MKRLHILHTNDLHSHFGPVPQLFAYVQDIRNKLAQCGEPSVLVDVGDHMDRAFIETEGTEGVVNQAVLEAFEYDVITFGNNELLSYSPEHLTSLYQEASFTVVSANVTSQEDRVDCDWIYPFTIINKGVRLGFIGVTISFERFYRHMGWKTIDPIACVQQVANKLKLQVDLVIVLSHLGYAFDRQIAESIPAVDIILGGHTHHILEQPELVNKTWIAAAGLHGKHLGRISVDWDDTNQQLVQVQGAALSVDSYRSDRSMEELIANHRKQAREKLSKSVITLKQSLPVSWEKESLLANLLADGLMRWTGVNIAIVNSGQLLSGLKPGSVTLQDLHQICPHPINPVSMTISGSLIRETLEQSLLPSYYQCEMRGFGFRGKILGNIAVAGLSVRYDPLALPGKKIQSIVYRDMPIQDDDEYRVVSIDMLTFGVGYPALKEGRNLRIYMPEFLRDVLHDQLLHPTALLDCQEKRWCSDATIF